MHERQCRLHACLCWRAIYSGAAEEQTPFSFVLVTSFFPEYAKTDRIKEKRFRVTDGKGD